MPIAVEILFSSTVRSRELTTDKTLTITIMSTGSFNMDICTKEASTENTCFIFTKAAALSKKSVLKPVGLPNRLQSLTSFAASSQAPSSRIEIKPMKGWAATKPIAINNGKVFNLKTGLSTNIYTLYDN
jgi:hypothetical protein